jgi:hypothetical protein
MLKISTGGVVPRSKPSSGELQPEPFTIYTDFEGDTLFATRARNGWGVRWKDLVFRAVIPRDVPFHPPEHSGPWVEVSGRESRVYAWMRDVKRAARA